MLKKYSLTLFFTIFIAMCIHYRDAIAENFDSAVEGILTAAGVSPETINQLLPLGDDFYMPGSSITVQNGNSYITIDFIETSSGEYGTGVDVVSGEYGGNCSSYCGSFLSSWDILASENSYKAQRELYQSRLEIKKSIFQEESYVKARAEFDELIKGVKEDIEKQRENLGQVPSSNINVAGVGAALFRGTGPRMDELRMKGLERNKFRDEIENLNQRLESRHSDLLNKFESHERAIAAQDKAIGVIANESLTPALGNLSSSIEQMKQRVQDENNFKTAPQMPGYSTLEFTKRNIDHARKELESGDFDNKEARREMLGASEKSLDVADEAFSNGEITEGNIASDIALNLADAAISSVPIVGVAKDLTELLTGKNVVTGETLSDFDKAVAFTGLLTLGLSKYVTVPGKILKVGSKIASKLGKPISAATSNIVNAAVNAAKGVGDRVARALSPKKILSSAGKVGLKGDEIAGVTKEVAHMTGSKVDDIYEAAAKNTPLGLGSTGRSVPNDLKEQAAMLVTRADPQAGEILPLALTDSRWPTTEGWQKMQTVFKTSDNRNIVIHYVRNKITGKVDDFKFKN